MKRPLLPRLSEKQRTIVLVVLLLAALCFIVWTRQQYDGNFTNSF